MCGLVFFSFLLEKHKRRSVCMSAVSAESTLATEFFYQKYAMSRKESLLENLAEEAWLVISGNG